MNGGLSADDVGKINKLQMNWIRENGRQYIGNRYWAKRTTDYVLDAYNFVWLEDREQKMSRENDDVGNWNKGS